MVKICGPPAGLGGDARAASETGGDPASDLGAEPLARLEAENRRLRSQLKQQAALLTTTQAQLRQISQLDPLTQIPNRRTFDRHLFAEWKRLARESQPLSLILCDLDAFQAYNDRYGMLSGDQCLYRVAQALRRGLFRPADQVARYSGQQFTLLLPGTPLTGAEHLMERLQHQVAQLHIPHDRSSTATVLTLSFGLASTVPTPAGLPTLLIEYADTALLESKREGRNRCSCQTF